MTLNEFWPKVKEDLSSFYESYFDEKTSLTESMLYTLKQGKKFRPLLCLATLEALGKNTRSGLAYAAAIEMVHAFSLIHDDLPALDNDDERRGKPTNHKVYGEDIAILAGDALLNEAYLLLLNYYSENLSLAIQLIKTLASSVGTKGMIYGQVLDLRAQQKKVSIEQINKIHHLKTGALIEASVLGAAVIAKAKEEEVSSLKIYAKNLGLAFQIADDLLEEKPELGSYVSILGREAAREELNKTCDMAISTISGLAKSEILKQIILENQSRKA